MTIAPRLSVHVVPPNLLLRSRDDEANDRLVLRQCIIHYLDSR